MLIVGAGLAGLSTAWHLERAGRRGCVIVEAEDGPGGWTRTDWTGPWASDRAIHVLHFRDAGIAAWVRELLGDALHEHARRAVIDSQGVRTAYPFHEHLHGRPPDVVRECLAGLREAQRAPRATPPDATFADWILSRQGAGVAKHFMVPYNTKLWTVPPGQMSCDWIGDFIPQPGLERILAGAAADVPDHDSLNATFLYPERGASSLAEALAARVGPVRYGTRLLALDLHGHRARLSGDRIVRYDALVSTIPLDRLAGLFEPPAPDPPAVRERLEAADLTLVDVGFTQPRDHETQWAYLPDPDVLGYRLHQVHALTRALMPPRHGLYCVEIGHSRHRPLPPGDPVPRVVADLVCTGWLRSADQVVFTRVRRLSCSYAIPRPGQAVAVLRWRDDLRSHDVHSIGRFGSWVYGSQEDALRDGRRVAARILGAETSSA